MKACCTDMPVEISDTDLFRMFFMLEFVSTMRKQNKRIGDDQLQKEMERVIDNVPGPRFTCNMLSGTSC